MNISDSSNISCGGYSDGSAAVLASGGIEPLSYIWDDPATTNTAQVTGLSANQYYNVTVTDAIGCIATDSVILTEPEIMISYMSDTINPTCYDYYMGSATVNVSGGTAPYSYLWDDPAQTTTPVVTGLGAHIYYHVTITDDAGCKHADSIRLSRLDEITSNIDIVSGISCYGLSEGSASLSYSGGTAPYDILWDDPAGSTTTLVSGLSGDKYYHVSLEDFNGCIIYDSIMIPQPPLLESSITNITGISYYEASDGSATITPDGGTPPYSYLWDDDLNTTDSTVSGLAAERYYHVLITDANSCTTTDSVLLPEFVPLNAEITHYSNVSCYGLNDGTATVTIASGNPPYTILWNDDGAALPYSYTWAGPDFFASEEEDITHLEPGDYNLGVTDGNGCTVASGSITITEPAILTSTSHQVGHITCFGADNGSISVTITGGTLPYTYAWTGPSGYTSFSEDISGLGPGNKHSYQLCHGCFMLR